MVGKGLFATTFDTETEVVAGVTVGLVLVSVWRLTLGERLGGVEDDLGDSRSKTLRFGEEFDDSMRRRGGSTPFLVERRSRSL